MADEWVEVPAAGEPVVAAGSLQTGPRCPTWTFQTDALFLWQNNIPSRPLYLSNATGLTALDVNDGPPTASVGPRFGLFYHLDACHAIEGNYFNVQSFQGEADVPRQAFVPGTAGTGYTALEAIKILVRHPEAKIVAVTSRQDGSPPISIACWSSRRQSTFPNWPKKSTSSARTRSPHLSPSPFKARAASSCLPRVTGPK